MTIYKTTNLINGKFYIGKQVKNQKSYLGSGKILQQALKKYGRHNFKKEIIEECNTLNELDDREKYWIKKLKAIEKGYNITTGGTGGDTRSNGGSTNPGFQKGNKPWNKGVPMREETKNKISKKLKGRSANVTSYKAGKEHPFYGKKRDSKIYQKIVETARKNGSYKGRPFKCINIKDGKVFDSLKEASDFYKVSYDVVKYSCKKHTNDFRYYEQS